MNLSAAYSRQLFYQFSAVSVSYGLCYQGIMLYDHADCKAKAQHAPTMLPSLFFKKSSGSQFFIENLFRCAS